MHIQTSQLRSVKLYLLLYKNWTASWSIILSQQNSIWNSYYHLYNIWTKHDAGKRKVCVVYTFNHFTLVKTCAGPKDDTWQGSTPYNLLCHQQIILLQWSELKQWMFMEGSVTKIVPYYSDNYEVMVLSLLLFSISFYNLFLVCQTYQENMSSTLLGWSDQYIKHTAQQC